MASEAPSIGVDELRSLAEVHRSIPVSRSGNPMRRLMAFVGPGYLVAVGYMDPGNWATDLAGGSAFGYTLLTLFVNAPTLRLLSKSADGAAVMARR